MIAKALTDDDRQRIERILQHAPHIYADAIRSVLASEQFWKDMAEQFIDIYCEEQKK